MMKSISFMFSFAAAALILSFSALVLAVVSFIFPILVQDFFHVIHEA